MPAYGEQDGYGLFGILEPDDDGLLVCHDCGRALRHLATHARLSHGYATAEAYRDAHGLARKVRLVAPSLSGKMSAKWEERRPEREALLARVRDPLAAGRASRGRPLRVGARAAKMTSKPTRDLTPEEVKWLGDWYDTPTWSRRANELLARRPELSRAAIARAVGRPGVTVVQRMSRYPVQDA